MSERGIKFDSFHTGDDWKLLLTQCKKGIPTPKTNFVSVEGRDGDLDLTELLTDDVQYNNRTDQYSFDILEGTREERQDLINYMVGYLNGRKRKIILPDWPLHYSVGRLTVTEFHNYLGYGQISVEANCEPWLYKLLDEVREIQVEGAPKELTIVNRGIKTVIPTITITGSVQIMMGTYQTTLSAGTFKVLDLRMKAGSHLFKFDGNGTVRMTWTEAIL